jgi:hypothetical protein
MSDLPPYLAPEYIVETPNGRMTLATAREFWLDAEAHGIVMSTRNKETGLLERVDPTKVEPIPTPTEES